MPITFRHDAAAVGGINNSATRKYGQALVLQQQQQKYDSVRRAQDRLYDAQRQAQGQYFQAYQRNLERDFQRGLAMDQQDFAAQQQKDRLDAQAARDADQAENAARKQTQINADKIRQIKINSIEDQIKNGEYPAHVIPKLREILAKEKEIALDPYIDDAMRASAFDLNQEDLDKLTPFRRPPPSPADIANGSRMYKDPDTGDFSMTRDPSKKQQVYDSRTGKPWVENNGPPSTFDEYRQMEPDKANKAWASKMAELQQQVELGTREAFKDKQSLMDEAYNSIAEEYNFFHGRNATPATAQQPPQQPGQQPSPSDKLVSAPAAPQSPIDSTPAINDMLGPEGVQQPTTPPVAQQDPTSAINGMLGTEMAQVSADEAARMQSMQERFNAAPDLAPSLPVQVPNVPEAGKTITFTDASGQEVQRKKYLLDGSIEQRKSNWVRKPDGSATKQPGLKGDWGDWETITLDESGMEVPKPSPANPWAEIAAPQAPAAQPAATPQATPQVAPPDFDGLSSSVKSATDRSLINNMKNIYKGKTPDVQTAISVLLNPDSLDEDVASAMLYLQHNGVDVKKLIKSGGR